MKFVLIVSKSAGNDSVGEMWEESHIFNETATLHDVQRVLKNDMFRHRVTITIGNEVTVHVENPPDLTDDDLPF